MISIVKKSLCKIKAIFYKEKDKYQDEVTYDQKRQIIDTYKQKFELNIFVETGTFLGDTIFYFKNKFEELYSIELSEDLANRAKQRFINDKNITIIQGDSANVLSSLLQSLNERALFWLDGHYSSEFYYNGEYIITAKSDKNTPIEQELDILLSSEFTDIILIDDARLFIGVHDYPTIEAIKGKVKTSGKNYSVFIDTDIIHIVPL